MKYPLIARVPEIWRRLDTDNVSRKLFGVIDEELERIGDGVNDYLNVTNIDKIPDKFLSFLSDLTGHVWRHDKTIEWNRDRIRFGLKRASYKGTTLAIKDLAIENGSIVNQIQDNASKLLILGKQGRLSCDDAYLVSKDYWHDGAFVAEFSNTGDTEEIINELPKYIPAGEIWTINFVYVSQGIFDTDCQIIFTGTLTFTEALQGTIGYGTLGGNLLLSSEPNGRCDITYRDTVWGDLFSKRMGSVGLGLLGNDVYLSDEPAIAPEMSYNPIGWHSVLIDRSLGHGMLGYDLFLSVEPATTGIRDIDDIVIVPIQIGPIVVEMSDGGINPNYTEAFTGTEFELTSGGLSVVAPINVTSTELEVTQSTIEIARLEMGSIHYTLADNITLDEVNR